MESHKGDKNEMWDSCASRANHGRGGRAPLECPLSQILRNFYAPTNSEKHNTQEEFEERAAIMQYDGGMSKEEAERLAAQVIQRRFGERTLRWQD